jgi:hypothetical protein
VWFVSILRGKIDLAGKRSQQIRLKSESSAAEYDIYMMVELDSITKEKLTDTDWESAWAG